MKNAIRSSRRSYNRFWRDYGYHRGHVRLRNLPEIFAIESTNYCNLRCIMCPRGEPDVMERSLGSMSDALFKKIIDQGDFFTEPCWLHWFGEPLMHPRLFKQIAYAKDHGLANLGISTNATLLNEARARKIMDSGLDTIIIALDGATKEVYGNIRKSPEFTFEEVRQNVSRFLALKKALGRKKPHTILSIIVMEENKNQLEAFKAFWTSQGADEILHKPYVTWVNQSHDFASLATVEQRFALANRQREHPCKYLWESVVIAWNGLVVPCCYDYDAKLALGDLNTQSLREIWNSERYVNLRRMELEGRNDMELCRNCNQAPGHARNPVWPLKTLAAANRP